MGNQNSRQGLPLQILDECPKIPRAPSKDLVQMRFDELLVATCTDLELREELNDVETVDNKWKYAFLSKLPHGSVRDDWLGPRECVELVQRLSSNEKCLGELFLAIRINMMLRPSTWIEQFVSEKGVNAVIAPLQGTGNASIELCNEVLSTLFVLTINNVGIPALLKVPNCCSLLHSLFALSPSNEIKSRSLKLLGRVCRESTMAQEAVMAAFSSQSPEDQLLQSLVVKLEQTQSDTRLLLVAVKFVNTLLECTRDRKQGASICEDLKANGFLQLLEPFRDREDDAEGASSPMIAQVNAFFEYYNEVSKTDKLGTLRLALDDAFMLNSSDSGPSRSVALPRELSSSNQGGDDETREPLKDGMTKTTSSSSVAIGDSALERATLSDAFSQLQQHSKKLDHETSNKLTNLLQKLATTLSDESGARQAVDRLEKSLSLSVETDSSKDRVEDGRDAGAVDFKPNQEPDLLARMSAALFPSIGDLSSSLATPGKSSLFSGFGDFALPASTPAKSSVLKPSFASFIGAESASSRWGRSADPLATKGVKLSLPFFQSSRKGPGLGVTPACTPIATASVRKDAKRPVFPSIPSPPRKEKPAELPLTPQVSDAVPPATAIALSPALTSDKPSALSVKKPVLVLEPDDSTSGSNAAPPLSIGTDVSKFRKLLSMGAPREAVRAKMQQAGVDPDLLDEQQGFTPKASPKPSRLVQQTKLDTTETLPTAPNGALLTAVKVTPSSSLKVKDDPKYAKFFKLLSMGAPAAAVKAKMLQAGLNSDVLDTPDAEAPASSSIVTPGLTSPTPGVSPDALRSCLPVKVKDDVQYAKFFKLLAMGAPLESVKAKMRMAGLQPELLDTPDAPLQPPDVAVSDSAVKVKEDLVYAKFFKLLSMGAPAESVKAKMRMAGLNADLLDTPDAPVPSAAANPPPAGVKPSVKVKDDPAYAKFFKLLSMGAPAQSVKMKMQMAGLKPELLDTPDAALPSNGDESPIPPQVKVKDDPAYAKFFKLIEMKAPLESVKAKMRMAGLQADLLDTPDALLPPPTQTNHQIAPTSTPSATNNAARRAHLAIAIKPAIKAKTRAFYWQQLKDEAIKGTIWEELEKESSNQNSQELLTLSESELEVLETEFPPPAACGPGTSTRRGSMSGIGSPTGPPSPMASPRVVFLIDRARSNNISIIIKQFRMSNATLRVAIMKMDSEVLTLDRVQGLIKILPTEDEIAAITGFSGDPTTLNGAELVLKELITIPRLKQRLAALETKHQFPALVRDLRTKINKIRTASSEITQSTELKAILLVILQVGNKMNHGTPRGGAKGFRMNDLTKLVQLKSIDKSVTLLHYVTRMVRMKKSNVVRLGDSLSSLYDVQSIAIPELQGDMNRINDITESINVELAAQRLKNRIEEKEESDLFVESMTAFVDEASKEVSSLKTDLDETLLSMRDTMLRFDKSTEGDDTSLAANAPLAPAALAGAGEFFSVIYEFTMSLAKADRENELKRIRDEKRAQQQQLKSATPRRSSIDRSVLTKLSGQSFGLAKHDISSLKVTPDGEATKVLDTLATASVDDPGAAPLKSDKIVEVDAVVSRQESNGPLAANGTSSQMSSIVEEKAKTVAKIPGVMMIKAAAMSSASCPLKKVVGNLPTGIPSPKKVSSTKSSLLSTPTSATPSKAGDAASLNDTKSELTSKHARNNGLPVSRTLRPEVETEGDDHDNNNNESLSPEKALSEAVAATQ